MAPRGEVHALCRSSSTHDRLLLGSPTADRRELVFCRRMEWKLASVCSTCRCTPVDNNFRTTFEMRMQSPLLKAFSRVGHNDD